MNINKVIIKDMNLLSNYEDFTKNFINIIILLLLNFYTNYNQMKLNEVSRNMTVFQTFLKLLKMIIILIKIMNSVRQFM